MRKYFRVTVLGNYSGRNAGDNAILGNLLEDISSQCSDVRFIVPTLNARFVREEFGHYRISALGMMPWNGALKIFGFPTLRAMLATDLILITDNILFDRSFFNPAFNYLSTISLFVPLCVRRGIPVILYNASVGPIRTTYGKRALQKVLDAGPIGILRDTTSKTHMEELGLRCPELITGADCALNTRLPTTEWIDSNLATLFPEGRPDRIIGLNVNSYLSSWQDGETEYSERGFIQIVSKALNRLTAEVGAKVVLFVTQVMDHKVSNRLKSQLADRDIPVIANPDYNYSQIAGILSQIDLLIGMRTHAQILAVSVGTPVVNINSYPKTRAFLETVNLGQWSIDVGDLGFAAFSELIRRAWNQRMVIREELRSEADREKRKARMAVDYIKPFMQTDLKKIRTNH